MEKQTLGATITSLRKERGMTQLELAEKMGVTDKAVSKWERDLSCPDILSVSKLAELFGVSVDELMRARTEIKEDETKMNIAHLTDMILKGIALAMGVAVTVLSLMDRIDPSSAMGMLGGGLACLAVSVFPKK